jgi:hypothetical protein
MAASKVEFTVADESQSHVWTYELSPASLLEDFGRGIMQNVRFNVDSVFGPLTFTFKRVSVEAEVTSNQPTLDESVGDGDEDDYDDDYEEDDSDEDEDEDYEDED